MQLFYLKKVTFKLAFAPLISICRSALENISKLPQTTNPLHFQEINQKAITLPILTEKYWIKQVKF